MSDQKLYNLYNQLSAQIAQLNRPAATAASASASAPESLIDGLRESSMSNIDDMDQRVVSQIHSMVLDTNKALHNINKSSVTAEVVATPVNSFAAPITNQVHAVTDKDVDHLGYAPNEMIINSLNDIVWYLYNYRDYDNVRVRLRQSITKETIDRFYSEKYLRQTELKTRGKCGDMYIALESFKLYVIDFIKYEMIELHDAGFYRDPRFTYTYPDDGPQTSFTFNMLTEAQNGVYIYTFNKQPTASIGHENNYILTIPACFINFDVIFTINIALLRTKYPNLMRAPFYSYFNLNTRLMSSDSLIFKRTNYGEFLQVLDSKIMFDHIIDLIETQRKDPRFAEIVAAGLRCLIRNNENNYEYMFKYIQHFNIDRQLVLEICTSIISTQLLVAVVDYYLQESASKTRAKFAPDFNNLERNKQERIKDLRNQY